MSEVAVRIPKLSVASAEATLTEVLASDGAEVHEGQPLFVMETEKVESEIGATASGVVHWSGTIGGIYAVGEEIGIISETG